MLTPLAIGRLGIFLGRVLFVRAFLMLLVEAMLNVCLKGCLTADMDEKELIE